MKLQTQFLLALLSAILIALIAAQTTQQLLGRSAMKRLSDENLGLLEKREQAHAENICQTIGLFVQKDLADGEMDKLSTLLTNYNGIAGILKYSIYDSNGVAAYSTSRAILKSKKTLLVDLKESAAGAQELNAQACAMKDSVAQLSRLVGSAMAEDHHHDQSDASAARPSQNGHSSARKSFHRMPPPDSWSTPPAIPLPGDGAVPAQNGLIAWNEEQMSTGVDSVDSQHQELIQRLNQVHAACVAGTAKEELLTLLAFLGE